MNMGIERYMFASAILMIVSQRLVRHLCKRCKRPLRPDEIENLPKKYRWLEKEGWDYSSARLMKGQGCAYCSNTGYHGRTGVFEIMEMNEEIKNMIVNNAPSYEVYKQALKDGMIPLRENCFNKVCEGQTTFFEMDRVTRS
jgi:type IV pilus assembly protein PilB